MYRLIVVLFLLLSACQPKPVKVTDLASFDEQTQRDGLVHGNLKVLPPTHEDNAKLSLDGDPVTLTKAHVLGIKSTLYQPSFRLEGVISPLSQTDVLLPQMASLQSLYVNIGDVVEVGDKLALFYHNTPIDDNLATSEYPAQTAPTIDQQSITITASAKGRIHTIYPQNRGQTYPKDTPVLTINDERGLKFVSLLPHDFKEHVSVGRAVNFSTTDDKSFSGQIEKISPNPRLADTLDVHVVIAPSEITKAQLTLGEAVSGYVEYGQQSVGILVPAFAIFDEALQPMDLSLLTKPPFKPATPIHAQLWMIKQDERLHLIPIQVIEYHPQSDHYLITGVSLTGLVVLANLPKTVAGKKVRLK